MRTYNHLIVGGGPAAGNAAQEFARQDLKPGEVAILSAEANPPYDRPPLSKAYIRGDKDRDDVLINDATFYNQHGIDLQLNTRVAAVDPERRHVETENGDTIGFEKMLLCTGSRVRTLGAPSEGAPIQYLRRIEDAEHIRDNARREEHPAVIGGGFIAMEVAASLAMQGEPVDLLFPGERPLPAFFTPEMAEYFARYYTGHGVTLHNHERVTEVATNGNGIEVRTESGDTFPADTVIAGIGVVPETALAEAAGLDCDDGILVDEFLATPADGIYAAGDVARYRDLHYGSTRRVEHWQNAVDQGNLAARNMLGQHQAFDEVPYLFSDMFDLSWEFWGDTADTDEVLHVGDVKHGNFSTWWLANGIVKGAFVLNRIDEERRRAKICVTEGREVPRDIYLRGQAVHA